MRSRYQAQASPNFNVLSQDQIIEIHNATLEVLAKTGVEIRHQEALELLKNSGCEIIDGRIARIPAWLVEDSIASAPGTIVISDRNGDTCMRLGANNVYFGSGSDSVFTIDPNTGQRKETIYEDVANAALVADYLSNIDFVMSLGLVSDCPSSLSYVYQFIAMVENSIKPIVFTAEGKDDCALILDMAAEIAGGADKLRQNPFLIQYSEPNSPLLHTAEALDKLLLCAEKSIPIDYSPGVMPGASGPITLAGSLVAANAEALSGIVIHQLKRRGAPIISGSVAIILDMRTTICSYGSPDWYLLKAACADIYHHYQIPIFGYAGCTDAHTVDQQAGIEASIHLVLSALSGTNLVHDLGYISSGLGSSLEMLVMCDEIVASLKPLMRGIEINEATLAVDVIDRVGPGGNFMAEDHTLQHLKREKKSSVMNRDNFEDWENAGAKSAGDKLNEKVRKILSSHKPQKLPESVRIKIQKMLGEPVQ